MPVILFVLLCLPPLLAAPLGPQERWSSVSDPLIMSKNFETRLFGLPLQAEVNHQKKFWSGDYWPLNKGNINYRWIASNNFTMPSPSLEQAKKMSQQQLSQLSPSEKFDLLNGQYHYPLKRQVAKISNPDARKWEGICHGWSPASLNHQEPTPKSLLNPDGIWIPFGSSDIKALLSYFYAYPYQVDDTHQVGRRCYDTLMTRDDDCQQDLNAGAFHIILANKIGLEKVVIADMDRYQQVWNHPIYGYKSKITHESRGAPAHSAPGTFRTVKMETTIYFADENGHDWYPVIGTRKQKMDRATFNYVLEIDQYGMIIGGAWKSIKRPDFLWVKERPQYFFAPYQRLAELLND